MIRVILLYVFPLTTDGDYLKGFTTTNLSILIQTSFLYKTSERLWSKIIIIIIKKIIKKNKKIKIIKKGGKT